jgi:NhaP-type Na+/H+ or K+/H+ antiporter
VPSNKFVYFIAAFMISTTLVLSGCAAALVAGGVAGGYMIAKDMEDGKLIDTKEKKKSWFGKN